jgi:catechol 2,3-dioxygenase-like lactoylglutathione lyase family enzyme
MNDLRIARVILFVKDMQRMLAFYEGTLGLVVEPGDHDPAEFVTLRAGSCELALHLIPERWARDIHIADPPEARESTPIKITFVAADVEAARVELTAGGARMGEVRRFPPRVSCDGVDPEGNVFQISNG